MNKHSIILRDSDADGVLNFTWDDDHKGIDVELEDIFGKRVHGVFYKKDLIRALKRMIKKLDHV